MKTFAETPQYRRSRLHPAEPPLRRAHAFEYASVYRPAKEAPGNFVETRSLATGKIALVIGDASALPDPLPILCIHHYLRRSLPLEAADPSSVAARMNGFIYDCCNAACSLTCFYAQYTPATGLLQYVNAGHDAPVLIRTNPDRVLRLEQGGPVFGLQAAPRYQEGFVHLKPGDRLVAFTLGVIDSLAARNTRSAENILISLIRSRAAATAAQLAHFIVSQCESASSGIQVDRTVLVASVNDDKLSTYSDTCMNASTELAVA